MELEKDKANIAIKNAEDSKIAQDAKKKTNDAWEASKTDFDWTEGLDWYIFHQVSKVHTTMLCDRLAIDSTKVPLTFPKYGNVGPAAVPITLASVQDQIQPGQRVLCMGIGSGLNTSFSEILW